MGNWRLRRDDREFELLHDPGFDLAPLLQCGTARGCGLLGPAVVGVKTIAYRELLLNCGCATAMSCGSLEPG